jgi:hypothetical protein
MPYGLLLGIFGQLTPVSTWSISEISLPYGPQKLSISGAPNESDITQSGEEPIITIDGLSGTTLTLSGTLADDSKSDDQLWNDLITPLLDLRGAEILLLCPISALTGTWTLIDFQPSRDKHAQIYDYTIRLKKSCLTIVMNSSINEAPR